jgi:mono/diheme cytochrome c family protein
MSKHTRILLVTLLGLASFARAEDDLVNPFDHDAAAAAVGKKLFISAGCMACHGGNARGAVGPDLTDDEWLRPFSQPMVFRTIQNGRPGTLMSPFKGVLSDEQIWQLVEYLMDEGRKRKASGE